VKPPCRGRLSAELADRFEYTLKMQMVRIKVGTFLMGSPDGGKNMSDDEVAQHQVKITRDFSMGATEVTVGQFRQFVKRQDGPRAGAWGLCPARGRGSHKDHTSPER